MMLRLSRQTVRHSWPPYVGALVALALGITLLDVAITLGVGVDRSLHAAGTTAAERAQLSDLSSLFGVMSGVAVFMAVFVVGSTFGFVVATRRRQLGLLRLVGATPRQVRRMVLGESAVVALAAAVVGCLLGALATPAFVAVLRWRGLVAVDLDLPAPWLAWSIAAPSGAVVALLGAWRASKRAARTSPVAAFQEAGVERRRPGWWQLVVGVVCLGGSLVLLVLGRGLNPVFAVVMSILLPEVIVVGLYCLGGWVFPGLAGLLGRPFAARDVSARLARDHVRTAVRTPVALAAPVLAISAIAGSMILALSLTADWVEGLDREQLATPYVVDAGPRPDEVAARLDGLPLVDARVTVTMTVRDDVGQTVEVVDPETAHAARSLTAVRGDLADLDHGVAVTESYASDSGVHVGSRLLGSRVVAVVRDAPDLLADVLTTRDQLPPRLRDAAPDTFFVDPGGADLEQVLAGTGAEVRTADAWIDRADAQTRAGNNLGLWVLLGPVGLYAGIMIVNSVLVGASQRRGQLRTVELLGATRDQLRRMALWEAGLVGGAGLLVGAVVTAVVGWAVRGATSADVPTQPFTLPWVPLSAIAATCVGLVLVAALVGQASARVSARTVSGSSRRSP